MLRRILLFSLLAAPAFAQQPTDPRAFTSTGVHRPHEDSASYRASGGVGGNLAHLGDAPLTEAFRITHQDGAFFFGLGLNTSQSTGIPDSQISVGEFDLLVGYSWDLKIPMYQALPVKVHFALASGLAICTNTVSVREIDLFPGRGRSRFYQTYSNTSLGIPLQFSAIYQAFPFIGFGPEFFAAFSGLPPSYGAAIVLEARY